MNPEDFVILVDSLNDEVWEDSDGDVELLQFSYTYGGDGNDIIEFDGNIVYNEGNSDRGCDDDADDGCIRSEREQIIFEMTELRDKLTKVINIIK